VAAVSERSVIARAVGLPGLPGILAVMGGVSDRSGCASEADLTAIRHCRSNGRSSLKDIAGSS
jgi:hypothetical protein